MSNSEAIVIRHMAFEDLGGFEAVLTSRGIAPRYVEAGLDAIPVEAALEAPLLIILGGPIGANDEADYPFLADELALLTRRLAADRPTLGICLGSQLMARALGARVYPGAQKEIGWAPLSLSEAASGSPLAQLAPERTEVLHWHGDTFDLPAGAVRLASTPICANQAFAWGERCLGLQFHPEVTVAGMERWFIGHVGEISQTEGISVQGLRADTQAKGPALERQGRAFFEAWLAAVLE